MIIKVLLLLGLAGAGFYAFRVTSSATHLAIRRMAGLLVLVLGAISVVFPDVTSWAASLVGVTRGADLVFYTLTVASLFIWSSVYARLHQLEDKYVSLVRRLAIAEAKQEASAGPKPQVTDSNEH